MQKNQITTEGYESSLDIKQTEAAIKDVKDFFERGLAEALNLQRVSAPLFVVRGSGINDDLNGVERKVDFDIGYEPGTFLEVVQSLAKWKRMKLAEYGFGIGTGLYTDMNAIRRDEDVLDNLHSLYVDQWDWEKAISASDRNLDYLMTTVKAIYQVMLDTEEMVHDKYSIARTLPSKITFVHSEDLARDFPDLSPSEREKYISEKHGAVFLIGIGGDMGNGQIHDGRAPDYDDWSSETRTGYHGINGDIIVWNPLLGRQFELSSMGIRVDADSLEKQLEMRDAQDRMQMDWHKRLAAGEFPESIGGGIGQSRLCMYFLQKAHIGEVQSSHWTPEIREYCQENGIQLL
jgi:aspartate--ammonia ligase